MRKRKRLTIDSNVKIKVQHADRGGQAAEVTSPLLISSLSSSEDGFEAQYTSQGFSQNEPRCEMESNL